MSSESWNREEETRLAEFLVARVCDRAMGRRDAECVRNYPHDVYFIGNLRPRPVDTGQPPTQASHLPELLNKLAPVAFGAEFRVRHNGSQIQTSLRLHWTCYYRVFPTLDEQREHQRHGAAAVVLGRFDEPAFATADAFASGGDQDAEDGADVPPHNSARSTDVSGTRGRRRTDVLFPKYRKLLCSAEGVVVIRRSASTDQPWLVDVSDVQNDTEREFARVIDVILADPDHLRTGPDADPKIRIPSAALESAAAYNEFKSRLTTDVRPAWRWSVTADLRAADEDGELVFSFEATNASQVDTRAWHSEGFFFDIKATLGFDDTQVLPFELEVAPRGFRYDPYRNLWGRGFNCAVSSRHTENSRVVFETTNVPIYAQPRYWPEDEPQAFFSELGVDPVPVLRRILDAMRQYEQQQWVNRRMEYVAQDSSWEARHGSDYDHDQALFRADTERFAQGCRLLEEDPDVRLAFQLTNQSFALGGQKTFWRLFQVVFIVSQIPGICAIRAGGQAGNRERNIVDIIYFPTGGGKTEAYLGVIVFHCFFDRLRGKSSGVTAWTRFPLRLLTLQQTQRVADVIGSAELIRAHHSDQRLSGRGVDGFGVGYFVGQEATPNELTPPLRGDPPDSNWSTANDPDARQRWRKILRCPACGTATVTVDFDPDTVRLIHRCSQRSCRFPGGVLPVFVVDNEIYRFLPSVVVGTIDKLAGLGNQRKLSLVLGQVTGRCTKHGYYLAKCCQRECTDIRRLRRGRPAGVTGPTLFIQDELHLLKEGLGTFDGHYETFLHSLLSSFGQDAPVKIIASSATIEAFDRQVLHLYGREARVFPGYGPELSESFYARALDYPQRLYVGLLPHNKTIFNAVLELFQYYHEEIETLLRLPLSSPNPFGGQAVPGTPAWIRLLDSYITSLGYFSATRELSSIRTDIETHVNAELDQNGFMPLTIAELSGSTSTDNVTRILESLDRVQPSNAIAPSAVLATSMISHGVDVDRFNCMIFYGMPKQTAEYIQSSSRVGRLRVGIVFTCLKPARERDQSHFSYFDKYHEFLGQLVEPVAINRWSKFSVQRTLPGLFMAVLLQSIANRSDEGNPNRFYMVDFVKRLISEASVSANDFLPMLEEAYLVNHSTGRGPATFRTEIGARIRQFMNQILGAGSHVTFVSDALVPRPMRSLRDVDEQVEIELDSNGSAWASRAGR